MSKSTTVNTGADVLTGLLDAMYDVASAAFEDAMNDEDRADELLCSARARLERILPESQCG
jgi:hypothetical protein